MLIINVSFVLKSDTNHSTFPFSLPCPMFSLNVGHKLRLHFGETDIVLSETRFPYLLKNPGGGLQEFLGGDMPLGPWNP